MAFFRPSKQPTPNEASVIVWTIIVVSVVVGIGAFYFAAKADAIDDAASFRQIGYYSIAIAAAVVIGRWGISYIFD
jgi:hypothetical protein